MLKSFFRSIFPKAPPSLPQPIISESEALKAIIYTLVEHIESDGSKIATVRVPRHTGIGANVSFRVPATGSEFTIEAGLNLYGDNVCFAPDASFAPPSFVTNTASAAVFSAATIESAEAK